MPEFQIRMSKQASPNLPGRCMTSCVSATVTHLVLATLPCFVATYSILLLFPLSVLALLALAGLVKFSKRLLGVPASAPAFVFFNVLFIWGVYVAVVRKAILPLMDFVMNAEIVILLTGWFRILSSNPGLVEHVLSDSNKLAVASSAEVEGQCKSSLSDVRVRYCRTCQAYIKGFDHHCPAFGNCIGQKNHLLFMALLFGFFISEASYVVCCSHYAADFLILDQDWQSSLSGNLLVGTVLFSAFQLLWQGPFLGWHIYCVSVNMTTDEWINWRSYPEFQLVGEHPPGYEEMKFTNPYNKGILRNMKEFLM